MLLRLGGKSEILWTTVGNVNHSVAVENSPKSKNRITMWSSCSICGYITKKAESKDLTRRVYRVHAALSTAVKRWKQPWMSADAGDRMNKRVCIQQVSLKQRKILTHATTWWTLKDIILSENSQTQKDKYCMTPLTEVHTSSQIYRHRGRRRALGAVVDGCGASLWWV